MYKAYNQQMGLRDGSLAKPNLSSWNSLLSAYAKAGNDDAAEKTASAIEKVEELFAARVLEARPNTQSFNCLMRAVSRSSRSDVGDQCERWNPDGFRRHECWA